MGPVENEFDGGLTIEGEIPVVEDVTVQADTEIPVESAGYSVPEADVHTEEHVIVVPDHKSDSSSSSSSDSDDDGVLPTEHGEKKKKVKKIKVKKEKKPKEKKEKKPKEKKEKKKKDKSFKIPDIDGGLTIEGETPAIKDVTVHADTEITVESVGISVPQVDVHTDVAIVETPTTDVEIRSKPVGTFDVNIGEQIDDLILTYQMDSKDETYSTLTGDVPCAVIELPEIPDTVLPMYVVQEDTVDVISEGVVEQGIDISTYEDKFSVKPKLDIDVSLPPVQDENKFPQAIELPKPMENDMLFLVAIENDIDASDIIGESFLSPVENELTSFSLIPMPVENEFDGGLTIESEIPVVEDVTVHADTEIPVESAGYSVPEAY